MRRPHTTADLHARGVSPSKLRWGLRNRTWQRVEHGVYIPGGAPPTDIERALAALVASGGVAGWTLAGLLHDLDGVTLRKPYASVPADSKSDRVGVRRRDLSAAAVTELHGYACVSALQALLDLASQLTPDQWECALESAVRQKLVDIAQLAAELKQRRVGNPTIREVLRRRPPNAPATGSILELDGQQHKGQPVYDASRETLVVIATGWHPGRFTWNEVVFNSTATLRKLVKLYERSTGGFPS